MMNSVLQEILASRHVVTRDGTTIPLNSEISETEGAVLQRYIRAVNPQVTLEVGLAYGVSALFICDALAEVHGRKHIAIDPFQRGVRSIDYVVGSAHAMRVGFDGLGLLNLERAGHRDLVEFHDEPSYRALPRLEAAGQAVDLAFIDGWHTFDYALIDFFYIDRMLAVGGVLILDDTLCPPVRKLARYIVTNRHYELEEADTSPVTGARRLFDLSTGALRAALGASLSQRLLKPDVLRTDASIGLRTRNFVVLRKTANDVLGDGSAGSRAWNQHHDF